MGFCPFTSLAGKDACLHFGDNLFFGVPLNVGWVERSETQQNNNCVGLRCCSNATCFMPGNPSTAVAPQPTNIILLQVIIRT